MGTQNRRIVMASDHRGASLKDELRKQLEADGFEVRDYGTNSATSVDQYDEDGKRTQVDNR